MIFAPPRTRGPLILAGAAVAALAFAVALILRGLALPVSFGAYFALTLGVALAAGGVLLGYWTWAAATLRYELRGSDLIVRWGLTETVLPAAAVERVVLGRSLPLPPVVGVRAPGLIAGRGRVRGVGTVAIFARFRQPADLLYLVTPEAAIGLALIEHRPFIAALQGAAREGAAFSTAVSVRRGAFGALSIVADRRALWLVAASLLPAWLSGLIVFSRYRRLGEALTAHFPPTEAPHLVARATMLQIPEHALDWFAVAVVAAAALHQRARLASYLVLAGSALAGVLFLVGAIAP